MNFEKEFLHQDMAEKLHSVVVGVQLDANGKELLDWAIGNIVEPGERVVIVHVCRDSDLKNNTTLSLIETLEDYLVAYEDMCSLKQVALVGRVSRGNSIRKVIANEAKECKATKVVVGINKQWSLGGSASLAKYCAKKLPPTTAVIAVQSGEIVFQREAVRPSMVKKQKLLLGSILHPSIRMDARMDVKHKEIVNNGSLCSNNSDCNSIPMTDRIDAGMDIKHKDETVDEVGSSTNRSDCNSSPLSDIIDATNDTKKKNEDDVNLGPNNSDCDLIHLSAQEQKLPEQKFGWPLLQKSVSECLETKKGNEARKISVANWAMKLPARPLPICTPHSELKMELKAILNNNGSKCKWFQYDQLYNSTNQFSSADNLIGKGGHSRVYKGCLQHGQQIAIKLINLSVDASKDFLLEVDILSKLKHKNIIPLIGICVDGDSLISVYSYFRKGSLENNLHGENVKSPNPWDSRFKVAVGVAEALSYLHTGYSKPVIHRDVKSSNILLTDDFKPKLSDFGLALWGPTTSSYLTHHDILGTFGYLAPEYFMYGKVSDKIDVYAFGVVLLELLTGRKPISDGSPKGQESLVMWAIPVLQRGDYLALLDPNLNDNYDETEMKRLFLAASLCLRRTASLRPQIDKILNLLRGEEEINYTNMAYQEGNRSSTSNCQDDDESFATSSIGSHLGVALHDVEDDASVTSFEQSHFGSLEEYLHDRWSRSSSFD